jgi:hypothetical protein
MSRSNVQQTVDPDLDNMITRRNMMLDGYGDSAHMPVDERGIYYGLCREIRERREDNFKREKQQAHDLLQGKIKEKVIMTSAETGG